MDYAYKIGQMVVYKPPTRFADAASGPYQIIQRMPPEGGQYKYRIKNPKESHVRVAAESELTGI